MTTRLPPSHPAARAGSGAPARPRAPSGRRRRRTQLRCRPRPAAGRRRPPRPRARRCSHPSAHQATSATLFFSSTTRTADSASPGIERRLGRGHLDRDRHRGGGTHRGRDGPGPAARATVRGHRLDQAVRHVSGGELLGLIRQRVLKPWVRKETSQDGGRDVEDLTDPHLLQSAGVAEHRGHALPPVRPDVVPAPVRRQGRQHRRVEGDVGVWYSGQLAPVGWDHHERLGGDGAPGKSRERARAGRGSGRPLRRARRRRPWKSPSARMAPVSGHRRAGTSGRRPAARARTASPRRRPRRRARPRSPRPRTRRRPGWRTAGRRGPRRPRPRRRRRPRGATTRGARRRVGWRKVGGWSGRFIRTPGPTVSTNGGLVSWKISRRPRTSTPTSASAATMRRDQRQPDALAQRRGERARGDVAERHVVGQADAHAGRGMPRPVATRPRSSRVGPASFSASSASRPQNASFFQPTAQPSRAWLGVTSRLMSWPCSG